jgi:hypothetical protein
MIAPIMALPAAIGKKPGEDKGVDDKDQANKGLRQRQNRVVVIVAATGARLTFLVVVLVLVLVFAAAQERGDLHKIRVP